MKDHKHSYVSTYKCTGDTSSHIIFLQIIPVWKKLEKYFNVHCTFTVHITFYFSPLPNCSYNSVYFDFVTIYRDEDQGHFTTKL